jgi:LacI family transcriptional regulator
VHPAGQKERLAVDNRRMIQADIARQARVSTATVDRVLNGRVGVKGRTKQRVLSAAVEIGYLSAAEGKRLGGAGLPIVMPQKARADERTQGDPLKPVALDFVLAGGANTFITMLSRQITQQATLFAGVEARVHSIRSFNPEELADALRKLAGHSDGVGVIGVDHPTVREAIRDLVRSGTPLLTLVSDVSSVATVGYVGIDNRAAGRLAGYLLGRFVGRAEGGVALFAGALAYRGHEEREMGFRHALRERFANLRITVHREIQDDSARAYAEAREILETYPDLVGLYNIGGGNRGIGAALEESGRGGSVVFIGHDLSEHTRRLLLAGIMDAVIDQNPAMEAYKSIERLCAVARGQPYPPCAPLPFLPIFTENIPHGEPCHPDFALTSSPGVGN